LAPPIICSSGRGLQAGTQDLLLLFHHARQDALVDLAELLHGFQRLTADRRPLVE
jgi:hypothetical protein